MTKDRWERIKQIFADALELDPGAREAFLRQAAADDTELLAELLAMLAEHDRDSGLLSLPAMAGARAAKPAEKPQFTPSDLLARRYRIVRFIARGGMGEVYEAEDLELGERVALKAIRPRVAPDADLAAMLKREIQLARRVTHPNVCRIFDLAHHEDRDIGGTTLLLSMELIDGHTLAEHLRVSGPLSFRDALPLIEDIAAGLQAVHDAGIVHGDLKPGNVMLVNRPGERALHAVVMDFGMALPVSPSAKPARDFSSREDGAQVGGPAPESQAVDNPPTETLAPPGWVLRGGTPDYFAPEQTQGNPATTATDVYALALVIADMLGVPRPARLKPQAERMPQGWARVLRRCLEADPARRYGRPAELAAALRQSVDGRPRIATAIVAALLLLLAAGAAVFLMKPEATTGTTSRQLLKEEEVMAWCPSPDGRYLAVTIQDSGDLGLRDVKTGRIQTLTNKGTSWDRHPGGAWGARFSPDGRQIAYEWYDNGIDSELRIISTDGRGERLLYREPNGHPEIVDWSADSRRVLARIRYELSRNFSWRMAMIGVQDSSVELLPQPVSEEIAGAAQLGADDGSIVFTLDQGESGSEIRRWSLTGRETTLVAGPARNSILGWSPDRRRLVFLSDRRGHNGIWAVLVSSRGTEGEPQELITNAGDWEPLGITRAGTLFYRDIADATDIYTAALDLKTGRTQVPPQRVMDRFVGSYGYPDWSEDGRQLVFGSNRDRAGPKLYVYDIPTGVRRELRPDVSMDIVRPQWTAHDGAIMVRGKDRGGVPGHFRVEPQTGRSTLFMSVKDLGAPLEGAWSRDGKIHFNKYPRSREIFRLDTATGERRILYSAVAGEDLKQENLSLSPDGRTLAFQVRRPAVGTAALMLVPAEGGPAQTLLRIREPEVFLFGAFTWTPDSRSLLVSRTRAVERSPTERTTSEIWEVPVDGGAPVRIDFPAMRIVSLRLNRDGKTVAFSSTIDRTEIWTLEKFL